MEKDVINTKYNINNIVLKHVEKFQSVVGIYIRFLGILEKNGEEYQPYKDTTEVRGKEFDIDFLTELKKQLSTLEQYLTYKKHFFFEVALLEINNDFLTKIPKYNVGRMDRSSDSTIREKACSNLDLLFFLVDYLQEVNWFALEQFVKECQFLNETGINPQYIPEYMIRNGILLKDIFQSEGNISSEVIETKHPSLENVKLVFDQFLDKFLAKYLEMADAIFENNKYNKTERIKDTKNWRRNKLLYKKYSEILVIPMDIFENITRVIKKSGFEYSSTEKTQSLKTFIYNDFLDNKNFLQILYYTI